MNAKFITLILAGLIIVLLGANQIAHAAELESISSFKSTVKVNNEAVATVKEAIIYNFSTESRHGIFRDIPTHYSTTGDLGYILDVDVLSVTRDGAEEQYETVDNDGFSTVKIGSADKTISGRHLYEITYTIGPVVIETDDGLQTINFDAPGTGWPVPASVVDLLVATDAAPVSVKCYQGTLGLTEEDCIVNGSTVSASRELEAGETLTSELKFQAGTFSNTAVEVDLNPPPPAWLLATLGTVATVVATVFGFVPTIAAIKQRGRRKAETVVALYEPPKDITPAEAGAMIDNRTNGVEITATLIEMAVKGHLKIKYLDKENHELTKLKGTEKLSRQEKILYDGLFSDSDTTTVKNLRTSSAFHAAVLAFKKSLDASMLAAGLYNKSNILHLTKASRVTDLGYKTWAEVKGFRLYLSVAEKDRLEFHNPPERTEDQFSKLLSYAVALEVEEKWMKHFKDIDISETDWYDSNRMPTALGIKSLSSLSSGISKSAAAATRSGSSSSGGFSSGGFSGGGFSGGGGGSW